MKLNSVAVDLRFLSGSGCPEKGVNLIRQDVDTRAKPVIGYDGRNHHRIVDHVVAIQKVIRRQCKMAAPRFAKTACVNHWGAAGDAIPN